MATDANRLLANQNAFIQASAPSFYQGNVAQLELHIVASAGVGTSPVEVPFPAGAAISVAVGDTNTYPTGGSWSLMVDTTETEFVPYNATTAQVSAALNALTEVSSEGGLTVSKTGDGYSITWNTYGLKPSIGIGSDTLTPSSYESISLVQEGSAENRQIVFAELRQNPIALGVVWTALPTPSVTVSEIQAWNGNNRIWRVGVDPQPKAGTITISYGSKTATLAYSASTASIASALSPAQVFATGQYQWDIVIAEDSVLTAFGSLVGYNGFSGSINFATAECHQFLAGAERKATVLEVSVSVDSKRYTLIQTLCNVFADVVSDGVLVPLPLGTAMSEQVANARFVRRDIDQNPNSVTQDIIWQNLGVDTLGSDVVGALNQADSPSAANPFATISDLSGLGATWGNITGTLSDQTDLQLALDAKYDASNPSGFIYEANVDGNTYGRRDGLWETVLPTTGGALTGSITNSTATYDTEMAGDLFGVQLSSDHTKGTTVEFDGLDAYDGANHMKVSPIGLTFPDSSVQTTAYTGGAGTAVWGAITGTLSDQTDLWENFYNYRTNGDFNFDNLPDTKLSTYGLTLYPPVGTTILYNSYINSDIVQLQQDSSNGGTELGDLYRFYASTSAIELKTQNWHDDGSGNIVTSGLSGISIQYNGIYFQNGSFQTIAFPGFNNTALTGTPTAPTPATNDDDTSIATTAYVKAQGYITSSALTPYLTSATAASTYQTISGMSGYAQLAGATFTGKVNMAAPTAGGASLNLGVGISPTTSVAGDIWIATNINYKDSSGTQKIVANTNTSNTFAQPQIIQAQNSTAALRVTQLGTGNTLLVEDSTNPDASALVVDASGNVGIGVATGYTATQKVEVVGNVKADAFINGTGPTYNVKAIQAHSGGSDTHELVVSVNGSTYRVGMKFVSTP